MARPRLRYLGPPGSFTHAGTRPEALGLDVDAHAARDAREVVSAVASGESDLGLLPLENSVEGDVPGTLDELVFGADGVLIRREVVVPVTFVLAAAAGVGRADVTTVLSHPHALGQCRGLVSGLGAQTQLAASTSQACADLAAWAAEGDPRAAGTAVVASDVAARLHGLEVLQEAVEDVAGAVTRMALLGRHLAPPSGVDTTLVVLTPDTNRTGILADALRCFADRGVALSRVSSRPLKAQLGTYVFVVAAAGHLADPVVVAALQDVAALGVLVKVLGCFPDAAPVELVTAGEATPPGSVPAAGWRDAAAALVAGAR